MKIINLIICGLFLSMAFAQAQQGGSGATPVTVIPSPYGGPDPDWAQGYNLGVSQKDAYPAPPAGGSDIFNNAYYAGWFEINYIKTLNSQDAITGYKNVRNYQNFIYSQIVLICGGGNNGIKKSDQSTSFLIGYFDAIAGLNYNPTVVTPQMAYPNFSLDTNAYHDGYFLAKDNKIKIAYQKGVLEGKRHTSLWNAFFQSPNWIKPPAMDTENNAYWFGVFEGANGHHCGN